MIWRLRGPSMSVLKRAPKNNFVCLIFNFCVLNYTRWYSVLLNKYDAQIVLKSAFSE